uniref:Ell-associated factor Eaf n=1 Tax=Clastoptera arizonana TaxID=38151 RepID=A0A1B6D330_9HEMI
MNGKTMADKLGLGPEVRELKLGPTFTNNKGTAFHTLRYDFKPASVDENKVATLDVHTNHEVIVTVPHLDGSGTMQTVFKGSNRPYQRECVLIIDRNTGEVTLEKLSNNIQLKKTRLEPHKSSGGGGSSAYPSTNNLSARPATPTEIKKTSPSQQYQPSKQSHKMSKTFSGCVPKHSPLHASPSHAHKSPTTGNHTVHKSPPSFSLSPVAAGSLPQISLDDINDNTSNCFLTGTSAFSLSPTYPSTDDAADRSEQGVGVLSDSSSSTSGDSYSSDSESDSPPSNNDSNKSQHGINGHINGTISPAFPIPEHLLNEDLQLSESASDSD